MSPGSRIPEKVGTPSTVTEIHDLWTIATSTQIAGVGVAVADGLGDGAAISAMVGTEDGSGVGVSGAAARGDDGKKMVGENRRAMVGMAIRTITTKAMRNAILARATTLIVEPMVQRCRGLG
jgi:uncharacterized membrane protein